MSKLTTLKNHLQEIKLFHRRVIIASLVITFVSILLISRLAYLQIFQHRLYTTLSKHNQLNIIPIEAKRGLIYDRNGVLLAKNIPVYSLEIIPELVSNLKKTLLNLQKIISIDQDDIEQFYKTVKQTRHFQSVPLKIHLNEAEVAKFAVRQYQFPGVHVKARLIRHYPLGQALAHVVGYVGRINAAELAIADPSNYSATDYIGKVGIEKYYERELHGTMGYESVETDASGKIVRILKRAAPLPGNSLYLTIDSGLQVAAEKALQGHQGAVVALQPDSGQILAMVSTPSYDPNLFVNGISKKEYQQLQHSDKRPLYNRAIRGQYPIASTIKPFLGLEGLRSGIINVRTSIIDPGYFKLPNNQHIYHDWLHSGHGRVNLNKAIIVSCDVFFYNLAFHMGIKKIDEIMREFGFGRATGIDMNEELIGLIPDQKWKLRHIGNPWYTGDTLNAGIGQGYMLTTPLQLADGVAALATRGRQYRPTLLLQTQLTNSKKLQNKKVILNKINVAQHYWNIVLYAMRGVISSRAGTGFRFGRNAPYVVAAKTGTAQVYSIRQNEYNKDSDIPEQLRDHSLFIAFAPFYQPKIAVAVIVEHSFNAPKIAREVFDYYLLKENHS